MAAAGTTPRSHRAGGGWRIPTKCSPSSRNDTPSRLGIMWKSAGTSVTRGEASVQRDHPHSGASMTTAPPVPDTIEQALDPAWLTDALGLRFPGIEVTSVTPGP